MNYKLIIIFFCFFTNVTWSSDSIVSFHGNIIKLPHGFKEISTDQLSIFKTTIFNRQLMSVYEKSDDVDGLQRIIVYYDSLSGTKNFTFEKNVEIKLEVINESGINFDNVIIDEQNNCVYGRTITQGDTSLFGFTLDGFGIMGIQFDNSQGINNKDKENFKNLITTIKHISPYQYIPEENPKVKESKKEMESSGLLMTIALVVMILIWVIRKYAVRN